MSVKVIAIGNRLMGDDGIGIIVAERIYKSLIKREIDLIIGETDFEFCMDRISNKDTLIIIDAYYNEKLDVSFKTVEECINNRAWHSQHSISLIRLLELYNIELKVYIICIGVKNINFSSSLSPELKINLESISRTVLKYIENINSSLKTF